MILLRAACSASARPGWLTEMSGLASCRAAPCPATGQLQSRSSGNPPPRAEARSLAHGGRAACLPAYSSGVTLAGMSFSLSRLLTSCEMGDCPWACLGEAHLHELRGHSSGWGHAGTQAGRQVQGGGVVSRVFAVAAGRRSLSSSSIIAVPVSSLSG